MKNDGVLPFDKNVQRVAVIGPFADSKDQLGPWQGTKYHEQTITLVEGLSQLVPQVTLHVAEGCRVNEAIEAVLRKRRGQRKKPMWFCSRLARHGS